MHAEQCAHKQHTAVTVLDVRRMNDGMQQKPLHIYQDMALLPFDLLPGIVARGIDRGPPFSALLTL